MDAVVFGAIWVLVTIAGEFWLARIHSHTFYFIITRQGLETQGAFNFLSVFLLPVFLFVAVFLIYTLLRFHAPTGQAVKSRHHPVFNKWFVGLWVGISFLLNIMFWLHPTASDLAVMFSRDFPRKNTRDLVVDVTARQWEWIFSLPQYGIKQAVNAQGQDTLELPVGRRVEFRLRSYDPFHSYDAEAGVIHGFWVPAFGIKEDVVPGETRYEYVTPTKIASYRTSPLVRVQCSEVCGPGHPWMEAPLAVVSPATFRHWVQYERKLQGS